MNTYQRYSKEWRVRVSRGWFKGGNIPHNKGVPISIETKIKLSHSLKGKPAWNKGIKMTEEQKNKLSKLFKGIHRSTKTEFKKGQFLGNKNPARQLSIREKISVVKTGVPHFNQGGAYHPNWKGGVTKESEKVRKNLEYKMWRRAVFARDNWTCQKCRVRGDKINSHHIHNFADFADLRMSIENGITLCKICHKEFHKTYGLKKNTKNELQRFLENRISLKNI